MRRAPALGLLLAVASCSGEPEPALEPIPEVDLAALDPRAASQIRERREAGDSGDLGMLYHAYTQVPAALACYRNARRLQPDDPRWPYYTALLLFEGGDLDGARDAFAAADQRMGGASVEQRVALCCHRGDLEIAAGDPKAGRDHFERALALRPGGAAPLLGLGRAALESDDPATARKHLERAVKLLPFASNAHYLLGTAYRSLGNTALAETHLRLANAPERAPAAVTDPLAEEVLVLADSAYRYRHLGARYFQAGRFETAAGELRKALAAQPDDVVSRTNLAAALARLGQREEAEAEFRTVLAAEPGSVLAYFNLGVLRAQAGDDAGAVGHYGEALAIDGSHWMARLNLANALSRLERLGEAREHYARVVAQDPANGAARLGEARMLILLGRHGDAKKRLEEGMQAVPDDPALPHELARLLAASPDEAVRDPARALALAEGALRAHREVVYAETVAMARAAAGNFEGAIALQEEAIRATRAAGRADLAARLERDLALYRSGRPRSVPWHPEEVR